MDHPNQAFSAPAIAFGRGLDYASIPAPVRHQAVRCLVDLLGVAAAGSTTRMAAHARAVAVSQFGALPGQGARMFFADGTASATGAAMASRPVQLPANCGAGTWTSHTGTWSITTGQAGSTSVANANASFPVGSTDMTAEVTMLNANAAGRIGGVTVSHTGTTRIYVAGVVSALNQVQIRFVNANTVTTLATATVTIGASAVLRLTRQGTAITLRVDGTIRATATLTAAQVTSLAAGTRAGLYTSSSSSLRFTRIFVTTPFA